MTNTDIGQSRRRLTRMAGVLFSQHVKLQLRGPLLKPSGIRREYISTPGTHVSSQSCQSILLDAAHLKGKVFYVALESKLTQALDEESMMSTYGRKVSGKIWHHASRRDRRLGSMYSGCLDGVLWICSDQVGRSSVSACRYLSRLVTLGLSPSGERQTRIYMWKR
ncbi:hypothetical protein EDB92DRAFT_1611574 [Lactarius akahatsu]|uniref:Uncharacterized protein n=1 Tax=Lactarius akahatsu TaxID=416441 RepID=A0AAD4LDQ6_9AGAM|nr:hypothetical protein EDB92DRAFT_1611574 [Lactarius akahatsu]